MNHLQGQHQKGTIEYNLKEERNKGGAGASWAVWEGREEKE